jgi:FKBP-type peptidyl-prolyl cis-trans isomerase SlyD
MASVAAGKVVTFHYTLTNPAGDTLDSSSGGDPLSYLHGAGNIVPGLENALVGKNPGDKLDVTVAPGEGYGDRDERAVHKVSRDQFPPGAPLQAGMQFGAEGPDGQPVPVWITAVEGDTVTIDFNHPLAGVPLKFAVQLVDVRDATAEELQHGHPHGPDGHGGHDHGGHDHDDHDHGGHDHADHDHSGHDHDH